MRTKEILNVLENIEKLTSRNDKPITAKGIQIRTVMLLLSIYNDEGHNQVHYRDIYEWSKGSVSVHTKTLYDYGFVTFSEDERDPRGSSKRIYLVSGVREYLQSILLMKD